GILQLPRRLALLAPVAHQLAVAAEHLDAMVGGVGHVQVAVGAQREGAGPAELSRLEARRAPAADELAGFVPLGESGVLAGLGDVVETIVILDDVADVGELAWRCPRPGLYAAKLLAGVGVVDAEAVIVRVGDDEIAVAVDAQPAGPAIAVVGGGPGQVE